jgi:alpha-tubulin suppressor-like RCC1 family protein
MSAEYEKKFIVIIYNYYVIKNVNLCILLAPITGFKHEIFALCSETFYSLKKSLVSQIFINSRKNYIT